jgi:hypothetical protein
VKKMNQVAVRGRDGVLRVVRYDAASAGAALSHIQRLARERVVTYVVAAELSAQIALDVHRRATQNPKSGAAA